MAETSIHSRQPAFGGAAYSTQTPSLASSATTRSSQSARTSDASDIIPRPHMLVEGEGGALEVPEARRQGRLACAYVFLGCVFRSDDPGEWDTHCKSHFCGSLPRIIQCPFVCDWMVSRDTGEESWSERNDHIVRAHPLEGVDVGRRADPWLIRHLWNLRIVDNAQLKELSLTGRLENNRGFLRVAGSNTERRRDRRLRGSAVV